MRLLLLSFVFLAACAHSRTGDSQGYWNETPNQSLHLEIVSLAVKNTKADVVVQLENRYPFTVVIPADSVHFEINGERAGGNSQIGG